jgi:hypothetical protein
MPFVVIKDTEKQKERLARLSDEPEEVVDVVGEVVGESPIN